jgi:thioredoxin reductase (NADPH)
MVADIWATDDPLAGQPFLGESQLRTLRRYGSEQAMAAGDVLFADGDLTYDLIVVLEGCVDVVEQHGRPDADVIVTYGRLEFVGEMGLLTGQRVFLTGVAAMPGRILRIPVERVRSIMAEEPDLSELILRSFLFRRALLTTRGSGPTLVGSRLCAGTRRLLEVLARNRLSSRWLELEGSAEAETLLQSLKVPVTDLPIVLVPGHRLLRNPSNRELLAALGLAATVSEPYDTSQVCDLLVVGGGPGGLAAAVYGASEGLTTTLAEDTALGGQAGTSSRIENYLGFPAGLSGEELAARGVLQAQKFGARIKLAARAVGLSTRDGVHQVRFDDDDTVAAKAVVIATGARYNRLPLERLSQFEGAGVFYAATQMEAQSCAGQSAVIVGGGNSAGQAAMFLARICARVHLVIRGDTLASSMSRYLIDQIERHPLIEVLTHTDVIRLIGETTLSGVEVRHNTNGNKSVLPACGLFVFIGAKPATDWLEGQLAVDKHGFVLTGTDLPQDVHATLVQPPLLLETSRPGIFCVGDVRSGSIKRTATAIGEGAMAVRLVFDRLQATGLAVAGPPTVAAAG